MPLTVVKQERDMKRYLISAILFLQLISPASGLGISIFGWNGNGGRRSVTKVADTIHDLYGVIDVRVSAIEPFTLAAEHEDIWLDNRFEFLGETGGLVLWNRMKLKRIESAAPVSRAYFATRFESRQSGDRFWFVLVDFDRRADVNQRQVKSLLAWINGQSSPVLICGNLGFQLDTNRFLEDLNWEPDHSIYLELKARGLSWVRPQRLYALPAEVETVDFMAFTNERFKKWNPVASIRENKSPHPPTEIILRINKPE